MEQSPKQANTSQASKLPVQFVLRSLMAVVLLALTCDNARAGDVSRADFLAVAKKGWVFELRSTVRRRSPSLPKVRINSRDIAGGSVCLIGEMMHPQMVCRV